MRCNIQNIAARNVVNRADTIPNSTRPRIRLVLDKTFIYELSVKKGTLLNRPLVLMVKVERSGLSWNTRMLTVPTGTARG